MVATRIATLCVVLLLGVGCKKKLKDDSDSAYKARPASSAPSFVPEIKHPVTDLAGKLSAADTESIARELVEHQTATGVQLAVLIVDTTYGHPIEDYAQRVFSLWGGGSAERNDGALFVLAIADRRNRLHLGYGLEPVIPDASAKRMLDDLRPHLRAADYAAATRQLVQTFRSRTAHLTPGGPRTMPIGAYPWMWIAVLVVALLAGIGWAIAFRRGLAAYRNRPKRDAKPRPNGFVRAGMAIADFFRYPPVALAAVAIVGIHFALGLVFRHGDGFVFWYRLVYWLFIPFGWLLGVKSKLWSIATAVLVVGFIVVCIALVGPEMFADGDMLNSVIARPLAGFFGAALFVFPFTAGIASEAGGGGGRSYSSSSSSRSSSSSSSSRSSSSSSSSSSRSYSGGGGRSGGGGASSSW